jgi:hypothetical protein
LAYQGDLETGEPADGFAHDHHIWSVDKVKALVANRDEAVTFFCGGSRNFAKFIDVFDGVFVEDIPKNGILIDATALVARVVDEIIRQSEADK